MSDWQEIVDAALERHKDGGSRLASLVLSADDHVGELEAKLAKAAAALGNLVDIVENSDTWVAHTISQHDAVITLAELKGETND